MVKAMVTITRELVPDEDPDVSYLEQDEYQDRLKEYKRGMFGFVGVQAVATISVPYGRDWIITHLRSPGIWGVENDSGEDHLNDIFSDEKAVLITMLEALHDFEIEEG